MGGRIGGSWDPVTVQIRNSIEANAKTSRLITMRQRPKDARVAEKFAAMLFTIDSTMAIAGGVDVLTLVVSPPTGEVSLGKFCCCGGYLPAAPDGSKSVRLNRFANAGQPMFLVR